MGDKGCAEERSAHANLHVTSCKNERARRKWVGGMEKRRWREGVCTKEANARAKSHVTSCAPVWRKWLGINPEINHPPTE